MDEAVTGSLLLHIDDASRVAESRRLAGGMCDRERLPPDVAANAALVAGELASNLWKHAHKGEIHFAPLSGRGYPGIEFLCVDRGPGMRNLAASLQDGQSTSGTAGTGLGAVQRLSDRFDISTQLGKGTILVSQIYAAPRVAPPAGLAVGLAARPIPGEQISGDGWSVRMAADSASILVADGLGHGPAAAEASAAAVEAFRRENWASPVEAVHSIHLSLRATRGAAVAVALLEFTEGRVRFAGLGNIAGAVANGTKVHSMMSHNGTAGHQARTIRELACPLTQESIVIMHSDGISSHWAPLAPVLQRRHPSVIAGWIYREAARDRDDACVVVAKKL